MIKKAEFCEIIEEQKVERCELINDQKVECHELIEDQKVEFCKLIEDQKVDYCETEKIKHQKVEDINMLKSGDETKKLNLLKKELRATARLKGVKNYENLSKSRLIEEIRKLKPTEGFEKIVLKSIQKKMN